MHPHSARRRTDASLVAAAGAAVLIATASIPTGHLAAQTTFRGGIDIVEADAVVLGANGRPIIGLTAADFTLSVDGQPRAIQSVEYVDAVGAGASGTNEAGSASTGTPPPASVRHIVFVVDEGNISAGGGRGAIASAGRLLDRLGSADRVALLSIPSGPTVDFTVQREPIRVALDGVVGRAARSSVAHDFSLGLRELFAFDVGAAGDDRTLQQTVVSRECPSAMPGGRQEVCEESLRAEAEARLEAIRRQSGAAVAGLDKLFQALAKMQGPKVVILVSEGLLFRPDQRDAGVITGLAARAAAARIALYSVLLDRPLVDLAESGRGHSSSVAQDRAIEEEGLKALTSESGGMLFRASAASDSTFQRLADALSGYYLIAFRVLPNDKEGPHRIRILTTHRDATIHARERFVMTAAVRSAASPAGGGMARPPGSPRRSDAPSSFKIDKVVVHVATRSIADADGRIRILFSLDLRDPAAHQTSALALGFKLKAGDHLVADTGRVVPVTHTSDGAAQSISYIAFQGVPPGAYELELSASDGTKHTAFLTHPVNAGLHAVGRYQLSDLLLAASAPNSDGPFPVPAEVVIDKQLVAGVELTAADPAALADAAVRFEVTSPQSGTVLSARDVSLPPGGSAKQFCRTTLDVSAPAPGDYIARASLVVHGAVVGSIDAPFRVAGTRR